MKKLPQRPRSHILETESRRFVQQILPTDWLIRGVESDYGIDLEVEIVENGNVTGAHFLIQLKSAENIIINKKDFIAHSCKTSALQYYLERTELVIYLVYDANSNVGYWVWIQEYLNGQVSQNWKKQKEFTVKIPSKNLFNKDMVEKIKSRVLRTHRQEKIVSTIQTLNHPGIDFGLELKGNTTTVSASYKYPNAEKDYPLNFGLTLNFDDTEEGKKTRENWENAFKKGTQAKINARFIKEFKTPDELAILDDLLTNEYKPEELIIMPSRRDKEFVARIEVFDLSNNLIAQVPYINFKEIRYGSEESLFSNIEQKSPTEFNLLVNLKKRETTLSFKLNYANFNVLQVKEVLNLQKAFADGGKIKMLHLDTGIKILEIDFLNNLVEKPLDIHLKLADGLTIIQEKTNNIFLWPSIITIDDYNSVIKAVDILTKGETFEGKKVKFTIDKLAAINLSKNFSTRPKMAFMFDGMYHIVKIFNQEINFGKTRIVTSQASPSRKTIKSFLSLEELPDDAQVNIELEVDEPGITAQYYDWSINIKKQ